MAKITYTLEADVPGLAPHRRSLYRTQLESMLDLFTSGKVRITGEHVVEEIGTSPTQDPPRPWRCPQKGLGVEVQRDFRVVRPS